MDELEKKADKQEVVDVGRIVHEYALDILRAD